MALVKKLWLGGAMTVAGGGAGVGVFIYENSKNSENENQEKPGEPQRADAVEVQDKGAKESPTEGVKDVQPKVDQGDAKAKAAPAPKPKKPDSKDLIKKAGLDCGEAKDGTVCSIREGGLKIDMNGKKENMVLSGSDNGKIKIRNDSKSKYKEGFRFTIVEKNISLSNGSSESITLQRYENYSLEGSGENIYLKRKMTVDQGKVKVLGLPEDLDLPTTVTKEGSSFLVKKELIWYIRFDGWEKKKPTSEKELNLKTYKIENSQTFKGGYRFSFQPVADLTMPSNNVVLAKDIWWDFRIKNPDDDDLILERVWKEEKDLLASVGLTCTENSCEISNGKLKIKRGDYKGELTKGEGSGNIKIHRKKTGYYEGLKFEIEGGDINFSSSSEKMEKLEVYEIQRDDDDSYYLTRKHSAKEVVIFLLGLGKCSLPDNGKSTTCTIGNEDLGKLKFHDGGSEKTVSGSGSLTVTISTATDEANYPYGHKFSLKPTGEVKVGDDDLDVNSSCEYKIKKGETSFHLTRSTDSSGQSCPAKN